MIGEKFKPILARLYDFLISVGKPAFFFLQICLYSIIWIGEKTFVFISTTLKIFLGVAAFAMWLVKQIFGFTSSTIHQFFVYIDRNSTNLKKIIRLTLQPKLPRKIALPKINLALPKISLPSFRFPWKEAVFFSLGVIVSCAVLFAYFSLSDLPNPHLLAERTLPVTTRIFDRNGILLYQIYAEQNRTLVRLNDIPPYLRQATIAFEDKNFYSHSGVDFRGIVRAAYANATGQPTQGGSTITQQLVKSALLSPERSWERKIREMLISVWAERTYSKDQILEMYFNQVPYGGEAYGIEAASETYFGKKVGDLDLAESALLAGLPSAPSAYSPFGSHPEKAKEKQQQVLSSMEAQGLINQQDYTQASQEQLHYRSPDTEIKAPHFVMYVKDYLINKFGIRIVETGGLNVKTTLDYPTYQMVLGEIDDGVNKQKGLNVGNGAALVVAPKTGEILAMVGSTNYFDNTQDGNVNVTLAERSPGSSIKPLTYSLAFEKKLITPGTVIDDAPVVYRPFGGQPYAPLNYDNRFHGRVTARVALGASLNIPAVKVLDKLGINTLLDNAPNFGINSWSDRSRFGLSLTLGGGEVTMLEMTQLYSIFADGGIKRALTPIISVTDYKGNILIAKDTSQTPESRVISGPTAFFISDILADNNARSLTFGPSSALVIPKKTVSVKTGTTQEKRDNWTIGYTPSVLTAVWVGNNDNSPMSPYLESGNTGAAAIWNPIMAKLLSDKPNEPIVKPDNLVSVAVCVINGLLTCDNCPITQTEYFAKGSEPTQKCSISKEERDNWERDQRAREKNH